MVSEELIKRPLHLRRDFEGVVTLLELVFAEEIEARGMDIRAELLTYKRILPLLKILGLFSRTFRYPMNGFVFETKEKQIIASVNTSSLGNQWEIAMVATHPEYRRRGLAKELVTDAIAFVKDKKGKICILEVIADNTPAYNLYRELGFIHYDSVAEMKLEPSNWPDIPNSEIPDEYATTKIKRDNVTNMQRYDLKVRETPEKVQQFLPIDKKRYKSSKLKNLLRPIMVRLFSIKPNSWLIYSQEELIGTIVVTLDKSRKNPHRIELVIDPDHQTDLAKSMVFFALSKIKESGLIHQNSLITVRSTNNELMDLLKELNFSIVENNHKLGLKFKPPYF
ncbi:MAG: GNAT family N-acetyltransferase [Candidatus Hodarchaeales archaeon]